MFLQKPTLLALSAALFVSSAVALPFDEASVRAKREADNEISIRYLDGHTQPLVHNIYFNGVKCANNDIDLKSVSHECLYSRVCFDMKKSQACTKGADFREKKVFDRSEIDSDIVCAQEVLCQRALESNQSLEEQEHERPKFDGSKSCEGEVTSLEYFPKECAFEEAIRSGVRPGTAFAPIYHDKGVKGCELASRVLPNLSKTCLKRFVDFYDNKNEVKAPSKEEFVSDKECQNLAALTKTHPDCVYEFANELDGRDRRFSDVYKTSFDCKTLSNALKTFPEKCFGELADYYDKKNPPPSD